MDAAPGGVVGTGVAGRQGAGASVLRIVRSTFFVAFVLSFVPMLLWAVANPMFASPDESRHIVRSESIVRLRLDGTVSTRIPAPEGWPCFSRVPLTEYTADCQDLDFRSTPKSQTNPAGNYPPLAHFIYGIPTLFVDGPVSLYLMRVIGALVCALAIATTVTILSERWSRFIAASVVIIAATPQVVFLSSSVNPSGIAITLSLLLAAGVVVAARTSGRESGLVRWSIVVSMVALPLLRRDSLVWGVMLLVVLAVAIGPASSLRLLRRRVFQISLAAFVVLTAFAQFAFVGRSGLATAPNVPVYYQRGVLLGPDEAWGLLRATMGEFGWIDTPLPTAIMMLGFVVVGTALVVGLVVSRSWWRIGIIVGIVAPFAFAALDTYQRYPYFQGRYMLPVLVVVAVLAGLGIERFSIDRRLVVNLLGWLAATMVAVQVLAFAHNLRRYSVGPDGPWFPGASAVWQPPILSIRSFDLLFAAVGVVVVAVLYLCSQSARSDAVEPDVID